MEEEDKTRLIPGIGPEVKSKQGFPIGDSFMTSLLNFEHTLRGGVPLEGHTEWASRAVMLPSLGFTIKFGTGIFVQVRCMT